MPSYELALHCTYPSVLSQEHIHTCIYRHSFSASAINASELLLIVCLRRHVVNPYSLHVSRGVRGGGIAYPWPRIRGMGSDARGSEMEERVPMCVWG